MNFILFQTFVYQNLDTQHENILFENLHFRKHLILSKSTPTLVQVMIQTGSGEFEFWSNKEFILSGKVTIPEDTHSYHHSEKVYLNEENVALEEDEVYEEMKHRKYNYSGSLKILKKLTITDEGILNLIIWEIFLTVQNKVS